MNSTVTSIPLLLLALPTVIRAQTSSSPGPITIARLQYSGGGDWYVGPSTLPNLLHEIRERTGLAVADRPVDLKLTDPRLWNYPFLFMSGHGNVSFSNEDLDILRRYLLSGGFLYADDCYGMDKSFRREMKRLFPDKEVVELPVSHRIYHTFYDLPNGLPKVHKHDGKPAQGFALLHEGARDGVLRLRVRHPRWLGEPAGAHDPQHREEAFRMGVNIFMYALAQVAK